MQFCVEQGCGVLVPKGRCPAHQRAKHAEPRTAVQRGYTTRWQTRSARFRARYPLCGMRPGGRPPIMSQCFDEGRATLAQHVDHVVPHKGDKRLFWAELENWQSLCPACHTRKTAAGL
jgi:5-methylcytosine-specific restriction enzyme A